MGEDDKAVAALPADVAEKLDRIANLLALVLIRRMPDAEKIRILDAVGYRPARIAAFVGKEPNAVSQTLSRQRGKSPGKKRKSTRKKSAARRRRQ